MPDDLTPDDALEHADPIRCQEVILDTLANQRRHLPAEAWAALLHELADEIEQLINQAES